MILDFNAFELMENTEETRSEKRLKTDENNKVNNLAMKIR